MSLIIALANTFQVTEFDVWFFLTIFVFSGICYYYVTLHTIFEAAFWAIVGLGIYILLSVLLLGNGPMGTQGGLFPFGFSVFIISIAVYLIFILAVLFPLHGGLIVSEPTHPTLYIVTYFATAFFLFFGLGATVIYMIDQAYLFRVGTFFSWFQNMPYYIDSVKTSFVYAYIIAHQNTIIPLAVLLLLYKLLLSNLINAAFLSVWYNLSHVGFYRKKDDAHYRVEFHEVGGHTDGHGGHDEHDDHGHGHDDHAGHGGHADHGHSSSGHH